MFEQILLRQGQVQLLEIPTLDERASFKVENDKASNKFHAVSIDENGERLAGGGCNVRQWEALARIMGCGGNTLVTERGQFLWPQGLSSGHNESFYSQGPVVWVGKFDEIPTREGENIAIDVLQGSM